MAERGQRGFTMVEVLVVVAIIALLGCLVVVVSGKMTAGARRVACLSNLREIGVALELYLGDHNNQFPNVELARSRSEDDANTLEGALDPYLDDPEVFHCPADRELFKSTGSSYFWNSTQSGRRKGQASFLGMDDRPDLVPLVFDKEAFHGEHEGANILYADYRTSNKLSFRTDSR